MASFVLFGAFPLGAAPDPEITKSVWKMIYGVTDAQMSSGAWLVADDDGDGVSNGSEVAAGTNPFVAGSVLKITTVTAATSTVNVSFPTEIGKLYVLQTTASLVGGTWGPLAPNVQVVGDGNTQTLSAPKSGTNTFYRVLVQDVDSSGDSVGDWAKKRLGYSTGSSIAAQSGYDQNSLRTTLQAVNVVTISPVDVATSQPDSPDGAATDLGLVRINRSGFMLLNAITVPLLKSGTAVEGTDYAALPATLTFPAGVNSLDIKVTPRYNANRTTSATVILTAGAPGSSGASGSYTLGTPSTASVMIYPSGGTTGIGLVGRYFNGSSTTYASSSNLGGVTATYTYAAGSATQGTATVTYTGTPAVAFAVGSQVYLTFTSGPLLTNDLVLYAAPGSTPPATNRWDRSYIVTAVNTGSKQLTVSVTGSAVPATGTGTGACFLGPFNAPLITRLDPAVDFTYSTGLPSNISLVNTGSDNWVGRFDGYLNVPSGGSYDFQIQADDGARVYLDLDKSGTFDPGEMVIDAWTTGTATAAPLASGPKTLAAGRMRIRVEYLELNNTASVSLQWKKPGDASYSNIPAANVFLDSSSSATGWTNLYWLNTSFAGLPRFAEYPAAINLNWGTSLPSQTLPSSDNFSIRWEGYVSSASGGTYNFNVTADDGAVVYVDLDQSGTFDGGAETVLTTVSGTGTSGDVTLAAGQRYKMRVDFTETSGNAMINLGWKLSGGGSFTTINASAVQTGTNLSLFRDSGATNVTGWWASYYSNATFSEPPLYSVQDTNSTSLNGSTAGSAYNYGATKPATSNLGSATSDNWGSRFDTYLLANGGAGTYQFQTSALAGGGDFSRLLLDGTEVLPTSSGSLSTVTMTLASPAVVTWSSHGLTANTPIRFTTTGALPTGLTAGTTYYVSATGLSTGSFQVSATPGGASINTSGTQSGTHTASTSTVYSTTLAANQVVHAVMEHYNISGNAFPGLWWKKPADTSFALVPNGNLFRDAGTTIPGVVASYWTNTALLGAPSMVQYLNQVSLAATSGTPSQSFTADNYFSTSWETYLQPSSTGTHTFDIQADDGARVYLDLNQDGSFGAGETIIDAWTAGSSTTTPLASGSYTLTAGQRYKLRVEFYDTTGPAVCKLRWTTPASGSMAGIPNTNCYRDATSSQIGVLATYYPNTTLTVPATAPFSYSVAENNNPEITFDFGSGRPNFSAPVTISIASPAVVSSPAHGLGAGAVVYFGTTGALPTGLSVGTPYFVLSTGLTADSYQVSTTSGGAAVNTSGGQSGSHTAMVTLPSVDNFTVRWTGQVLPQYSGTYFFDVRSDDGAKLWVNNQLVVNKWGSQGVTDQLGTIDLQADMRYDITLEYLEVSSSAEVHLYWYSYDQAKQIIPLARLFPSMTGVGARPGDPPAGAPAITSPTNVVTLLGAGSPFSLALTASNGGGSFTASGLPSWLTLSSSGVLSGTPTQAGTYQFTVTTTNAAGSGSAVVTVQVNATGSQLTRELWTSGVGGAKLSDVPWTSAPTTTDTVSSAEDNTTTYATNTGERLRGYITAPSTGNYYFWISASNAAELWISNDKEPVNKVRRCYVSGPTGTAQRTWNTQIDTTASALWPNGSGKNNQQSGWLALTAGQKYYIEILHNTGASGAGNNLSVGWFLDPTGNSAPITTGAGPADASTGGVVPGYALSPWDNPPTIAVPGSVYIASLQGVGGINGVTGSGGASIRVNGSTGVVHLNYLGLTSGVTFRRIYAIPVGNNPPQLLFDLDGQDKDYPGLKTSDQGYTWNLQASDLSALNAGGVFLSIGTVNNPGGELAGIFALTSGSQIAPSPPAVPSWADDHATDAGASRFLSQASFGPSPTDMAYVKANGYRAWIDNQFTLGPTYMVPYLLTHLNPDPNFPYISSTVFNAWWKNSITAPDQLRQRMAFALSEILVVSDTGPLNLNGRTLADYYDTLALYGFDNYRNILKQVTLTSAMGVYLDMRGNDLGNLQTGLHPNENYAREIMQLFSVGLYRRWADGTLILDSSGNPIPTYGQNEITGLARVFTGWTWGQSLLSTGRLPSNFFPSSNYLDPMVLVPSHHELGTKVLLDNVMLPASVVNVSSDSTTSPYPIVIQSTDPTLGAGNLVSSTISNNYDLNGLKDLEATLESIHNNSSIAPYICRQLIQRFVTSHPTPAYVYRVVQAFNGERNVDGVATGVRGDMKDVIRAILLDYEARSSTAKADSKFGKQREPVMRLTGPARAFPSTGIANCTYRQNGLQQILVTTPTAHRLTSDTVLLDTFVDGGSSTTKLPAAQGYGVGNTTPAYSHTRTAGVAYASSGSTVTFTSTSNPGVGTALYFQFTTGGLSGGSFDGVYTVTASSASSYAIALASSPANTSGTCTTVLTTITAPAYQSGDTVAIQFTSGTLGTTAPYNTVQNYTVRSAGVSSFAISLGSAGAAIATTSGSTLTPNNFTVNSGSVSSTTYTVSGTTLTVNLGSSGLIADGQHRVYLKFATGGLRGGSYDNSYLVASVTTGSFTVTLPSVPSDTTGGTVLMPKMSADYTVTTTGGTSTFLVYTSGNHGLNVGDQVQFIFSSTFPNGTPAIPPTDGIYTVSSVAPSGGNSSTNQYLFQVVAPSTISSTSQSGGLTIYPLSAPPYNRSGTCSLQLSTWNMGSATGVTQTPLNSTTVFNFFYPDYTFPGAIAQAGMTTPEFQLTNDSNIINLTNTLNSGILSSGNPNGFTSFTSGGGAIFMDLGPYMTQAQTADAAIPTLVDTLGTLLAGGNLQSATKTKIASYVTTNLNAGISSISQASPCVITTSSAHGLATGDSVTISGVTGGTFSSSINSTQTVTVTGPNTFTFGGINCTSTSGLNVAGGHVVFTPFPLSATPTNTQMRDRVRAIVHLILVSPEYAIQK